MQLVDSMDALARQEWLDPTSDGVQRAVSSVLRSNAGRPVDNFLNGTWLGHPLHPILVAVPFGAWTVGLLLDGVEMFTKRRDLAPGADAATLIGLAGALGSAASGLAQWQYTDGRSRRLGMVHATLNTAATLLYGVSVLARARGRRSLGHWTALVGYGVTNASAYIGGDLVYNERIGVVHTPELDVPQEFTPTVAESALAEGALLQVDVQGSPVLLARQQGHIYALGNVCSHLGGPLAEGTLQDCSVVCPWHASRFALDDGRVLDGPASFPQPCFETRVREGKIEVRRAPKAVKPAPTTGMSLQSAAR